MENRNKRKMLGIIFTLLFVLAPLISGASTTVFVAPGGDGDGTLQSPFGTLEEARDAIRALKAAGGSDSGDYVVCLREGVYTLTDTFELGKADSGTEKQRGIYQPYEDEQVFIRGGVSMKTSDFEVVSDESILDRLPQEARGKVVQASLKEKGIHEYGQMPLYGHSMIFLNAMTNYRSGNAPPELFYGDEVMTLARWPNEGFKTIDDVVEVGSIPRNWMADTKGGSSYIPPENRDNPPKGFVIKVSDEHDRLKRWAQADDVWMFGYWCWDWSDQSVRVASIDAEEAEITTVQPSAYGVRANQRFYVYNLLEELDMPGEWHLDRKTGILYFYPPTDDKDTEVKLSLLEESMIAMNDVSHVIIRGLNFGISRGNAVTITGGANNLVVECGISKMGGNAVTINGGIGHGVENCTIYDMGSGGILLAGGSRETLAPANHFARNNHIYNFARIAKTYNPAIGISGVGNKASFNKIHNGPHAAIIFSGNDHTIEYNELFDVIRESQDMGAIYSGRDLIARGTVIRHNFIHSIKGVEGGHSDLIYGIYFDDMFSGTTVFGNVFYDLPTGIHVNGGRDNIIDNNIFINIANRPIILSTTGFMEMCEPHWKNTGYGLKSDPNREDVEAQGGPPVPWNTAPYKKYANLANILEDEPMHPKYNSASRNVLVNSRDVQIWLRGNVDFGEERVREYSRIEDNFLAAEDVGFIDASKMNFGLKADSIVYEKIPDFEPIPFELIGRQTD